MQSLGVARGVLTQTNITPSNTPFTGLSPARHRPTLLSSYCPASPFFAPDPFPWRTSRRTPGRVQGSQVVRAYLEPSNTGGLGSFFKKVQGALPVIGLLSRLVSEEGGVGTDRLRYSEFCRRVERGLTREAAEAFEQFQARHGKMARKPVIFLWCWATAVGAGLIKSDDLILGARRMRYSYDMEYELDVLDMIMEESLKKRAKAKGTYPEIPVEARAQKALEAVCACCIGKESIPPESGPLLETIFAVIFPTIDKEDIRAIVADRVEVPLEETSEEGSSGNSDISATADASSVEVEGGARN